MLFSNRLHRYIHCLGYLEDQERYGLVYRILDENETIKRAVALVTRPNIRREWQDKRERLVRDKIDVTAWIVDWVEAYTLTGQS